MPAMRKSLKVDSLKKWAALDRKRFMGPNLAKTIGLAKKKDFRLFPDESPKDGIGCSLNISKKIGKRITSFFKSVHGLFFFARFTGIYKTISKIGVPKNSQKKYI